MDGAQMKTPTQAARTHRGVAPYLALGAAAALAGALSGAGADHFPDRSVAHQSRVVSEAPGCQLADPLG